MSIDFRITAPDEWRAASDVMAQALHAAPVTDEQWPDREPSWAGSHSMSAWDGDRCVGHGGHYFFDTIVPGGEIVATAGVTRVGVLPTRTRRGILTEIMSRLLHDAHDQQRPLASLRASEAVIYNRFGFGVAGEAMDYELVRPRLRDGVGITGSIEFVGPADVLDVVPPLYDRIAFNRPGVISRPEWMWRRYLEEFLAGGKSHYVVLHRNADGEPDGYADYSTEWPESEPKATAEVADLWGADPEVEAALWRFIVDVDLIQTIKVSERPLDDLVKSFLVDRRALRVKNVWDEQWIRLVDVGDALRARSYNSDEALTIGVTDRTLPFNSGTWQIADGKVEKGDGAADLDVDISALGATYLGATSWFELAATPAVTVNSADAVARADRLFAHRPLPRCGSFF